MPTVVNLLFCILYYTQHVDSYLSPPKVHEIRIIQPMPMENVIGRDTLRLECLVSGYPIPSIDWLFNGVKFIANKSTDGLSKVRHTILGNRLIITGVQGAKGNDDKLPQLDSGRYRCIASNSLGSVFKEKHIRIRVLGKFTRGNRETDPSRNYFPTVGKDFVISCPPHTGGYGTVIKWGIPGIYGEPITFLKAGNPSSRMFPTPNGDFWYRNVEIDDIKKSRDTNGIRCILINQQQITMSSPQVLYVISNVRKPVMQRPILRVHMPSHMVTKYLSTYTMTCAATGYPIPEIKWFYDGKNITRKFAGSNFGETYFGYNIRLSGKGNERLIIEKAYPYKKEFRCMAVNKVGQTWRSGKLYLYSAPKWVGETPDSIIFTVGESIQLNFNATGTPEPTLEWFKNGKSIEIKTSFLKITNATNKDSGMYTCVARNVVDTVTASVLIQGKDC